MSLILIYIVSGIISVLLLYFVIKLAVKHAIEESRQPESQASYKTVIRDDKPVNPRQASLQERYEKARFRLKSSRMNGIQCLINRQIDMRPTGVWRKPGRVGLAREMK